MKLTPVDESAITPIEPTPPAPDADAAGVLKALARELGFTPDESSPLAIFNYVVRQTRELENYKVAYALSLRRELQRLAPGGRLTV
jgi:hypothetical protein